MMPRRIKLSHAIQNSGQKKKGNPNEHMNVHWLYLPYTA